MAMTAPHRSLLASARLVLVSIAFCAAAPAHADSEPDPDHVTLGAGAGVTPRFEGSDEYRIQPLPLFDVQWGRFFARTADGIGVDILRTSSLTLGASVTWMQGYDGDDVPEGIGGVDDALGARIFVSARHWGAVATLSATQAVTEDDRGLIAGLSFAYPVEATERLSITPGIGTTWASAKYARSYFGVSPGEAAASGLERYDPSSGFKDVTFRIGVSYRVTDDISLRGSVGIVHLLDVAADSPLVEQQTHPIALMGLTYTF
ncbi:MipA/OmpV family protein [Arenibaculum pallidiluteum]|uniref:MipA/OmpV family protein n=1 Tax=Arenibaculum pallidiluteum TaxID=2812559 RepID=UPI001A97484D|nr:MipA/OmpV family protein [Arenibaculum pallidiluteum]